MKIKKSIKLMALALGVTGLAYVHTIIIGQAKQILKKNNQVIAQLNKLGSSEYLRELQFRQELAAIVAIKQRLNTNYTMQNVQFAAQELSRIRSNIAQFAIDKDQMQERKRKEFERELSQTIELLQKELPTTLPGSPIWEK